GKHRAPAALLCVERMGSSGEQRSPPPTDVVALPALAKLEGWIGLSALPDYEFVYRLSQSSGTGQRHWVLDVRRQDAPGKGPIQVKRVLAARTRISPADERVFTELARHE